MVIIYLDIDGVLNHYSGVARLFTVEEQNLKIFAGLVHQIDDQVRIVLSSSWRTGWSPDYKMCTKQIQELINRFKYYDLKISGVTGRGKNRWIEIQEHLKRVSSGSVKYVIIDDDITLFPVGTENLYITGSKYGITSKDVKKIMKML